MLLPHIVEFNSDINKHSKSQKEYLPAVKRYANVAHILGLSNYNKVMTVRSLVNWIQFMQKEMNIPLTIQELGTIAPEEYFAAIDKMADAALADACTVNNPRVPTKEDIIKIIRNYGHSENEDNNFRQMLTAAEIRYRRWRRDEYLYKKRRQRNYRYGSCR